jgi:hypothetical protein
LFKTLVSDVWSAVGGEPECAGAVEPTGDGALASVFATSDLAAASIAAAGLAIAEYVQACGGGLPRVRVDRRLASMWFFASMRPQGWAMPPLWDPIAGDYRSADGWIRLHTNAPHHRRSALAVLGCDGEREAVAAAVLGWDGEALEAAIAAEGGCAAVMRTAQAWAECEQGRAVAAEPLVILERRTEGAHGASGSPQRPLKGVRVLDLTRVLAGPVATRFLAGYGADVLRIDPPDWDEAPIAEVALGKRCARLDLKTEAGLAQLQALLREADVLVHGYRADALDRLGLSAAQRRALRPGLIDVCLNAYGWSGPWRDHRGFDSLVQMSSGIAHAGMVGVGADRPTPLPVQALDHATGYLLAAAAVRGLTQRLGSKQGLSARASLARTAALLMRHPTRSGVSPLFAPGTTDDLATALEASGWGPMRRLRPPVDVAGAPMRWSLPAQRLGSSQPCW